MIEPLLGGHLREAVRGLRREPAGMTLVVLGRRVPLNEA